MGNTEKADETFTLPDRKTFPNERGDNPATRVVAADPTPPQTLGVVRWNPKDLQLIKNTVAKGTTDDEFRQFIEVCKLTRLNPFKREIYCIIFNADKPNKRQCVHVVSIGGYETIAQRNGDYIGIKGDIPPVVLYDEGAKDPDTNPRGLVSVEVKVWRRLGPHEYWDHWGIARWDELAPMYWDKSKGKRCLKDGFWKTMPVRMLEKCAEAASIRRAWPSEFGGVHVEDEYDRAIAEEDVIEAIAQAEEEERLALVKLKGDEFGLIFDDKGTIEPVTLGKIVDRCAGHLKTLTPEQASGWKAQNLLPLKLLWSKDKPSGKEINRLIEERVAMGAVTAISGGASEPEPEPGPEGAAEEEATPAASEADTGPIPNPDEEPAAFALWLESAIKATGIRKEAEHLWATHRDKVVEDMKPQVEETFRQHWESLR